MGVWKKEMSYIKKGFAKGKPNKKTAERVPHETYRQAAPSSNRLSKKTDQN